MKTTAAMIGPDTVDRGDVDKLQDLIFPIEQDADRAGRRGAPDVR